MLRTTNFLLLGLLSAALIWPTDRSWAQGKAPGTGSLSVEVIGLENSKGVVRAGLFTSDARFPLGVDGVSRKTHSAIEGKRARLTFDEVPHGTYAIVVYHDENANKSLDKNWVGMPREGAAVYKPVDSRVPPPDFDDCKFEFDERRLDVQLEMNYL